MTDVTAEAAKISELLLSRDEARQAEGLELLQSKDDIQLWDAVISCFHDGEHADCDLPTGHCLALPYRPRPACVEPILVTPGLTTAA